VIAVGIETRRGRFPVKLTQTTALTTIDLMKTMPVGELKARFSQVLEEVKGGEEIVVSYGKKHENVAVLIPYATYRKRNQIRLGLLENQGSAEFTDDFKMTSEEFIGE
jgi:prevent-host-death family protein